MLSFKESTQFILCLTTLAGISCTANAMQITKQFSSLKLTRHTLQQGNFATTNTLFTPIKNDTKNKNYEYSQVLKNQDKFPKGYKPIYTRTDLHNLFLQSKDFPLNDQQSRYLSELQSCFSEIGSYLYNMEKAKTVVIQNGCTLEILDQLKDVVTCNDIEHEIYGTTIFTTHTGDYSFYLKDYSEHLNEAFNKYRESILNDPETFSHLGQSGYNHQILKIKKCCDDLQNTHKLTSSNFLNILKLAFQNDNKNLKLKQYWKEHNGKLTPLLNNE